MPVASSSTSIPNGLAVFVLLPRSGDRSSAATIIGGTCEVIGPWPGSERIPVWLNSLGALGCHAGLPWGAGGRQGVRVHGDGRGEVLNILLRAVNGGYRDHYLDVDFSGWRHCELTRPETDRVFEFSAGYSRKHTVRHFQYDNIRSVFLRYNSIPANSEVRCLVGPVKALREHWLPVKNPAFSVRGETIMFPCQVETEGYLEFTGEGKARLFDREGVEVREVVPQGDVPVLQQGPNRISFRSEGGSDFSSPPTAYGATVYVVTVCGAFEAPRAQVSIVLPSHGATDGFGEGNFHECHPHPRKRRSCGEGSTSLGRPTGSRTGRGGSVSISL